jgi:hypothetical protein
MTDIDPYLTDAPNCPACGGPPTSSDAHHDDACPLTRTKHEDEGDA